MGRKPLKTDHAAAHIAITVIATIAGATLSPGCDTVVCTSPASTLSTHSDMRHEPLGTTPVTVTYRALRPGLGLGPLSSGLLHGVICSGGIGV